MLTRTDLLQITRACRQGWDTPTERQQRAIRETREVLEAPNVPERLTERAFEAWNAMEAAGWVEAANQLLAE